MLSAIEKAQSIQLSDREIHHYTHGGCNIVSYTEIERYGSMDALLGEHGACALLFETARPAPGEHVGHWVALTKRTPDTVEFFGNDMKQSFVSLSNRFIRPPP
jgi:hypothetical protein